MNKRIWLLLVLFSATLLIRGMHIYHLFSSPSSTIEWAAGASYTIERNQLTVRSVRPKNPSGQPTLAAQGGLQKGDRILAIYDLPPLRERGDDVLLFTEHYIKHFNEKLRKRISGVTPEVAEIFRRYGWPGNVRELRNVVERAMILEDEDLITTNWLPRGVTPEAQFAAQPQEAVAARAEAVAQKAANAGLDDLFYLPPEGVQHESVEMSLVEQAMRRSGGNQTRAAELLGISRDQLRYRLKKLEGAAAGAID